MPSATPAITTPCLPVETEEQTPSLPTQQQFVCYMCCDKVSTNESIILTACSHRGCNSCTTKWIKKQEDSGQATSATCPYCRANIHDDDVIAILGRPFKQREALTRPANEEIDDLTLQWFNDQTKLCPGCGSRVEKLDGCDHMTCLCGCEFCFGCGSMRCLCNGDEGTTYPTEEEPIRDANGIVNLRACMSRKNGKDVRRERALRRYETMAEEEDRWTYAADDEREGNFKFISCDGKWLFSCRKSSKSVVMLMQLYKFSSSRFHHQCREKRQVNQQRRYHAMIEEENRWMSNSERVRNLHLYDHNSAFAYKSCDGKWLFSCRKSSTSAMVLMQQCNSHRVRQQRYERRQSNQGVIPVHPSWLMENEGEEAQLQALQLQYVAMQPAIVAMARKKEEQVKTLKTLSYFSGMMGNELLDFFGLV
mmetsp:Transcript_7625/g.16514  ORF Transcript_7625/g.16514 Transcript_7625/m.16514 type:complete len:421 (+) Transcript_7625:104-1366(+)